MWGLQRFRLLTSIFIISARDDLSHKKPIRICLRCSSSVTASVVIAEQKEGIWIQILPAENSRGLKVQFLCQRHTLPERSVKLSKDFDCWTVLAIGIKDKLKTICLSKNLRETAVREITCVPPLLFMEVTFKSAVPYFELVPDTGHQDH